MVNRICLLILLSFGFAVLVQAQDRDSTRSEVQEDLEDALESFDPENPNFNNERLTQYLQDLAANPININTATVDMLLRIPGVNLKVARGVVDYRKNVKPYESVNELTEVSGLGPVTLEKMRPYVTIGSGLELGRALYTDYRYWTNDGNFEVFSRYQRTLQKQAGFKRSPDDGGYLGSPFQYYQRFRYRSDHLSVNITQQKDAGERLGGPTDFDYNSWHIALENNGQLRQLVVGDYDLSFGQGLVLWDGASFGKGREVIGTINRNGRGVSAYSSAQETNGFRGVAATYGGKLQLSGFYSYRKRTASVIAGDTIRAPQTDGFNRTQNDLEVHNNTRQELYGGHLRYELPFGFIGATGYKTVFNKYIDGGNSIADRYDFSGVYNSAFGIDYKFLVGPAVAFGEAARSQNGGYGFITGLETPVGTNTELTLAYRNYAKDFQSILGNGFGEVSGQPQNEKGIYLGLRHTLNDKITLSAYMDQYRFPAPRFGTSQSTQGYDWLALVEVDLNRNLQFYVQGRSEIEDDEFEVTDEFGRLQQRLGKAKRSTLRGQLQYWVNPKVRLRTRGEVVQSRQAGESTEYGYLFYQDVRFVPGPKWTIDSRITMYSTESFDTRVYQFENDLLYVLSNEVLFGQGQRLYLLVNYEPLNFLEIWAKFGITIFEDEQVIGSGLNEINGNKRSDVGIQVRLLF
ncbi:MAG: helix-hairpin-helix domain-containing protein [Balneolaceae bacterium]|nr:helix-hairpin-helix domain-containing protein [Balneolaceae bacterium]